MSHDPDAGRNVEEKLIALQIMKDINAGRFFNASIPRTRDGVVSFDVQPVSGSNEYTVIVSRNDRASE